jgi:hypothetical protein
MSEHLLRDTDQNRSNMLLLVRGQVLPELMGGNRAVGIGGWRRSGKVSWHRS